jgi:hypothetical protein
VHAAEHVLVGVVGDFAERRVEQAAAVWMVFSSVIGELSW